MDAWMRGATAGGCMSAGVATLFPHLLGLDSWPRWLTVILGLGMVAFAVHWFLREFYATRRK